MLIADCFDWGAVGLTGKVPQTRGVPNSLARQEAGRCVLWVRLSFCGHWASHVKQEALAFLMLMFQLTYAAVQCCAVLSCAAAVLDPAVAALQQHLGQCEARLRSGEMWR